MPAATKTSSYPSALKSATVIPHGQYVSAPIFCEISSNFPPPLFAQKALPKILFDALRSAVGDHSIEHHGSLFTFSNFDVKSLLPALICAPVMSECMSVTYRSIKPSRFQSKNFT